jgi:hypothetical protein
MKKTFEFGGHLLALAALTASSATVQPDIPSVIRLTDKGTAAASFIPSLYTVNLESNLIRGTLSSLSIAEPTQVDRQTTPSEEVIGQLRAWKFLGENWDGEGANIPNSLSIEEAVAFVNALTDDYPVPEAMLHPSGRAGLYWNERSLYADLEFTGEGNIPYYVEQTGTGKHKGAVVFAKGKIPPVLATLLKD